MPEWIRAMLYVSARMRSHSRRLKSMIRRRGFAAEELPDPDHLQELRDAFDELYDASGTKEAVVCFLQGIGGAMRPVGPSIHRE